MLSLSKRHWSPYVAGIVIGLLQIPAFLLVDTALGASSSFVTAGAWVASLFDAGASDIAYFAKYMSADKYIWQSALVLGIALGALLSARASGSRRAGFSPAWTRLSGVTSLGSRLALGFVGGFVLLLGARIAGGCTSGHGISGMAQLAVGSTVAVAAMFVGGILTAALMKKI